MCVHCLVFSSVYKLTSVHFIFVTDDLGFRVVGSDQNMQEDDHELDKFIRQRQAEEAAWEQQCQEEVLRQRQSELLDQQHQEEEARVQQRQEEVLRQRQVKLLEQQRKEEAEILEQHRIKRETELLEQQEQQNELNFLVGQQQHQIPFHQVKWFSPKANDHARWSEKTKDDLRERNEEQRNYLRFLKRRSRCLAGNYVNGNNNEEVQHAPSAAQHGHEMEELTALEREFNQEFKFSFPSEQID
jgi:hypothetical protein